jgi:hypothetical protein
VSAMENSLADDQRTGLQAFKDEWQLPLSLGALATCMHGWAHLHGFITLEMYNQFAPQFGNLDTMFEQQMRASVSIAPFR